VIAIVISLMTITFATLFSVRSKTDENTCSSHLRSLFISATLYQNEHDAAGEWGSLSEMGFPHSWYDMETRRTIFGTDAEWLCPAPKRVKGNYRPHYRYTLAEASGQGTAYLRKQHDLYGDRLPFISDLNHNNHGLTDINAPRVRKRVLYVDLQGRFVSKLVTGSFEVWGEYAPYEP
jgi:hypothetical protein